MCLHNILIDRKVPLEIRPPLVSNSRGDFRSGARPHINNNGSPGSLLSGDGAGAGSSDTSNLVNLREPITTQMEHLEMKLPGTVLEHRRFESQLA